MNGTTINMKTLSAGDIRRALTKGGYENCAVIAAVFVSMSGNLAVQHTKAQPTYVYRVHFGRDGTDWMPEDSDDNGGGFGTVYVKLMRDVSGNEHPVADF